MKKDMSATYKTLEEPHGVLMNHKTPWARGMNRSLDGLRLNLSSGRTNEDWAMKISQPRFESVTEMGGGGATPQHNLREIATEFRGGEIPLQIKFKLFTVIGRERPKLSAIF